MVLLGAKELIIEESKDTYTKHILEREKELKQNSDHTLLGEIKGLLESPLRSSSRKGGPTFFSDSKELTYYVGARKSGKHILSIGRSNRTYEKLRNS